MNQITLLNKTYTVDQLLGVGKGGYSYLVERDGREYVLKDIHHEHCDYSQFDDKLGSEVRDYRRLKELGIMMPKLYKVDYENERLLKEYIDGETVFERVLDGSLEEAHILQLEQMCEVLYRNGLNIDYFPTNFITRDGILYYIDYECNPYSEQWNFQNWGKKYWTNSREFCDYCNSLGLEIYKGS